MLEWFNHGAPSAGQVRGRHLWGTFEGHQGRCSDSLSLFWMAFGGLRSSSLVFT